MYALLTVTFTWELGGSVTMDHKITTIDPEPYLGLGRFRGFLECLLVLGIGVGIAEEIRDLWKLRLRYGSFACLRLLPCRAVLSLSVVELSADDFCFSS